MPLEGLQQQIAQGLGQNSAPLPDISPSLTELLRLAGASPPLSAAQEAHDLIASLVSAGTCRAALFPWTCLCQHNLAELMQVECSPQSTVPGQAMGYVKKKDAWIR